MFGTAHAELFHIRERAHSCAHAAVGVLSNCGDNLRNLGQLWAWFCLFLRKEHGEYVKGTENRVHTVRSVTVCMEFMSILTEFMSALKMSPRIISGTLASCMAQTMH